MNLDFQVLFFPFLKTDILVLQSITLKLGIYKYIYLFIYLFLTKRMKIFIAIKTAIME